MALLENMFRKHVMELGTERWNWGKKGRDWLEVRESSCGQAGAGTWVSLTLTMHLTSTTWSPWRGKPSAAPCRGRRCLEVPEKSSGLSPLEILGAA